MCQQSTVLSSIAQGELFRRNFRYRATELLMTLRCFVLVPMPVTMESVKPTELRRV
jgi:hypothetical protein